MTIAATELPHLTGIVLLAKQVDNSDQSDKEAGSKGKAVAGQGPAHSSSSSPGCQPDPIRVRVESSRPFPCAVPRLAERTATGPFPIVLTRLHFSQGVLSAMSWPSGPQGRLAQFRRHHNQAKRRAVSPLKRFQSRRHVLTRPVATNHLVPRSIHSGCSAGVRPLGAQTAGAIPPCKTAEPRTIEKKK